MAFGAFTEDTGEWKMSVPPNVLGSIRTSIRMDTMPYVQDKCANCGHNVDSAGQMGAHTRELWRRRRSTLLTTASDNSRGVKSLGKPSLFSRRAVLL